MPLAKLTEEAADIVAGVHLTHPDKVLFPSQGLTKRDLAVYLQEASGRMLPHLADRPLSLVRCPEGQAKQCFFQRHAGPGTPKAIHRLPIPDNQGKPEEYLYLDDVAGLIAACQLGVLEFHIWGCRRDDPERPDRIVFDLDPDSSVAFAKVTEAAVALREALERLGLASFALLSGGKGVHVVVPLVRRHQWPDVKGFALALARRFADEAPSLYVATMSKAKRKGKIFIDTFRNDRSASAIAPYSPRAREGAPIACPIAWEALPRAQAANMVTVETARQLLSGPDPWADYARTKQNLRDSALKRLGVV